MTWEAAAAVPAAVAAVGDAVGTVVAEFGAASCHPPFSTSNNGPVAATCAPSHASHSLKTVANCVRHSSPSTSAAPSSGFSIGGGGKHKFLEWLLRHGVVALIHSDSHLQGAAVVRFRNLPIK